METIAIPTLHRPLDATVVVPGSKSIANRALVCAALADGATELVGVPDGDDTTVMIDCLRRLGVVIEDVSVDGGDTLSVRGTAGVFGGTPQVLPAGLAGTTSRFVTALAALAPGTWIIDGQPPLRARPMAPLHDALAQLGVRVHNQELPGHLPVVITGPARRNAATVTLRGDVSSQYITALMLIAPYLPGGLTIELSTPLVSRPYVVITQTVMTSFGVADVVVGDRRISVGAGRYRGRRYAIEPDASSAGYPLAAAAICGGEITVPRLGSDSMQGDVCFVDVLAQMGCTTDFAADSLTVHGSGKLRGVDIDMVDLSDLVPTLAVVAACADSPSTIRGVGFIRHKESNRLGDLSAELRRLGADASDTDDGVVIQPCELHGARLGTHHDHRLAMAFGVLGLRVPGIEVEDPGVVTKSWPGFWSMLDGLR